MKLLIFLSSTAGLAFLHFAQTVLFSLMVYILLAEYIRTKRDDLIYKLVAAGNITLINIATTTILVLKHFYNIAPSQKYYPLIFNSTFAIIVLSLTRAFVYNYIRDKQKFRKVTTVGMISFVFIYIIMQIYWVRIYEVGDSFLHSNLQLLFSVFFILVIFFSIYYIARFRKKYRFRLIIAFISIIIVQLINIYGSIHKSLIPSLLITRSAVPFLVPIMFGSVVFKELIENVVIMVEKLQEVLENQRDLVFELMKIGAGMSELSDGLVKMSITGWQKLSAVVDNISAQENDRENIFEKSDSIIDYVGEMLNCAVEINFKNDITHKNISLDEMELSEEQNKHYQVIKDISKDIKNFHSILNESRSIFNNFENNLKDILRSINQIEEISDETGMLALNASIEAARAGKMGKGFGVVAQGVAELSDRSQKQTNLLNTYIRDVAVDIDNYNKKLLTEIKEFQKSYNNMKFLRNYFKDGVILSTLYKNMALLNTKKGTVLQEKSNKINKDIHSQRQLLDNNRKHGEEMKEAIRKHISDIEAIAGVSDDLKMMVEKLNSKTNKIIDMVKELEVITR